MEHTGIIIGTRHYNSLGIIRSLGTAGIPVTFASTYPCLESKYITDYLHLPPDEDGQLAALVNYISELPVKPVIFPSDDKSVKLIDKNYKILEQLCFIPHAYGNLQILSDKYNMCELARETGLKVPVTNKVKLTDYKEIISPEKYPVIIKPVISAEGDKGDIRICHNDCEYSICLNEFIENGYHEVIVQEFIQLKKKFEIGIVGFCLPDGEVIIPGTIRKIRSWPPERGSTTYAKLMPEIKYISKDLICKFIYATKYIGLFDIEFITDGENTYFIEINYRNGAYGYSMTCAGYNMPLNFYYSMIGRSPGIQYLCEIHEIYFMAEEDDLLHVLKTHTLSFLQWCVEFKGANHSLYNKEDMRPFIKRYIKIPDRVKIYVKGLFKK